MSLPRSNKRELPSEKNVRRFVEGVIFDLDGTLLNTIEDLAEAMNTALNHRGYPSRSVKEVKHLVGEGTDFFVRGMLPPQARRPDIIANLIDEYRAEYTKTWTKKTKPYPDIVDMLNAIKEQGIPVAILSNKRDAVVKQSVARFLPGVSFAEIRGAQEGVPLKPDATVALEIAARMGCDPGRLMFVGDTKTDMQTARAAGMIAVGALWGFRTAEELRANGSTYLVARPFDILNLPEFTLSGDK